jgi:hypothetical protein
MTVAYASFFSAGVNKQLALLYTAPRAVTVTALFICVTEPFPLISPGWWQKHHGSSNSEDLPQTTLHLD